MTKNKQISFIFVIPSIFIQNYNCSNVIICATKATITKKKNYYEAVFLMLLIKITNIIVHLQFAYIVYYNKSKVIVDRFYLFLKAQYALI